MKNTNRHFEQPHGGHPIPPEPHHVGHAHANGYGEHPAPPLTGHHVHEAPPLPHHHEHGELPHPPHAGGVLPPHIRQSIVKVQYTDELRERLEETYGDALDYVLSVIDSAPAEIKLTLAMLLDLPIDLSGCAPYVSKSVKFPSPLLNEVARQALGQALGENNLENAIAIYNASPAEQVLIAVTIAAMTQHQRVLGGDADTEGDDE